MCVRACVCGKLYYIYLFSWLSSSVSKFFDLAYFKKTKKSLHPGPQHVLHLWYLRLMLICVNIKNDVGHPKQCFITADLRWVWKNRAFVSQILIKHQQYYAWVHSWRTDYRTGEKGSGRRNTDHTDLTDTSCLCKFLKPHMKIPVCAVPSSDRQVFVRYGFVHTAQAF